jgi:N-acetyl-1-D-myo-inositol-2-amino-2-deoxy-alpha-D-glucopyranoside deacetylase
MGDSGSGERRSLLFCYAHPDDESFGTGGTMARYAAEGVRVSLVCATRGESGEISDPALATPENLGQVRENELRCACGILGVSDLFFLGYRDSGMAGAESNDDPRSLYRADVNAVAGQVVQIIRQVRPQVVVTFEPGGGYGHPDHIAIHKATVVAFDAAGDAGRYPEQLRDGLEPWRPQKLYYTALPRRFFRGIAEQLRADGVQPSQVSDRPLEKMGIPDELVTTFIDVSGYVESKLQAVHCHRTQLSEGNPFRLLSIETMRQVMSTDYFILSQGRSDGEKEADLFAGVDF